MKNIIIISIAFLTSSLALSGQILESKKWCLSKCDIVGDEKVNTELVYLRLKNESILKNENLENVKKIPLRIGVIQEDTNMVAVKEVDILRAIDNLNASFKDTNFLFYLERTDVIITPLKLEDLSIDYYSIYNSFSDKFDEADILSIYIFDHRDDFCNVSGNNISCGRTGGFSYILSERTNNIVMSRFDISDIKVMAHEMGHFWGLYHTFEEAQFGKDDLRQENCHLLGDRICDTPPDPGAVYEVYVNYITCELSELKNKEGLAYKPQIENYMSYYKPCYLREFTFTPDQIMVMKVAAMEPLRSKFTR
jgi:hypothetical protein